MRSGVVVSNGRMPMDGIKPSLNLFSNNPRVSQATYKMDVPSLIPHFETLLADIQAFDRFRIEFFPSLLYTSRQDSKRPGF